MDKDIYLDLIYKSLESTLNPEEQETLNQWIQESDDHEKEYKLIIETWDLSEDYPSNINMDIEADYAQVQQKISNLDKSPNTNTFKLRAIWRYAAVGLLLLATGAIFYYLSQQGQSIKIQHMVATEIQTITLPDQSTITLREGSNLSYPNRYPKNIRSVSLQGEALFNIEKDQKPFIVNLPIGQVEVLGTTFTISTSDQQIFIQVQEGRVQFSIDSEIIQTLNKDQSLTYNRSTREASISSIPGENIDSWVDNQLIFESTPLNAVINDLSRHYTVNIQLETAELKDCQFSGTFDDVDLAIIMETLEAVFQTDPIDPDQDLIMISGGKCPE